MIGIYGCCLLRESRVPGLVRLCVLTIRVRAAKRFLEPRMKFYLVVVFLVGTDCVNCSNQKSKIPDPPFGNSISKMVE